MDINMTVLKGRDTVGKALETFPDLKIVAVTMYCEEIYFLLMIEAGVKETDVKNSAQLLIYAIKRGLIEI